MQLFNLEIYVDGLAELELILRTGLKDDLVKAKHIKNVYFGFIPTGKSSETVLNEMIEIQKPDILVLGENVESKKKFAVLMVETSDHVQTGANAYQRFPVLATAAEHSVPCIYFVPYVRVKRSEYGGSPRSIDPRIIEVILKLNVIYTSSIFALNWPTCHETFEVCRTDMALMELKNAMSFVLCNPQLLTDIENQNKKEIGTVILKSKIFRNVQKKMERYLKSGWNEFYDCTTLKAALPKHPPRTGITRVTEIVYPDVETKAIIDIIKNPRNLIDSIISFSYFYNEEEKRWKGKKGSRKYGYETIRKMKLKMFQKLDGNFAKLNNKVAKLVPESFLDREKTVFYYVGYPFRADPVTGYCMAFYYLHCWNENGGIRSKDKNYVVFWPRATWSDWEKKDVKQIRALTKYADLIILNDRVIVGKKYLGGASVEEVSSNDIVKVFQIDDFSQINLLIDEKCEDVVLFTILEFLKKEGWNVICADKSYYIKRCHQSLREIQDAEGYEAEQTKWKKVDITANRDDVYLLIECKDVLVQSDVDKLNELHPVYESLIEKRTGKKARVVKALGVHEVSEDLVPDDFLVFQLDKEGSIKIMFRSKTGNLVKASHLKDIF